MAQGEEKKTAVALEYEPGDRAPKVIASGQGHLAEKIIDVAKEAMPSWHVLCQCLTLVSIFLRNFIPLWQRCWYLWIIWTGFRVR